MTLQDIEEVYQIELLSFKTPWAKESFLKEITTNKNVSNFIIAQYDNKIIGYAGIYLVGNEGHITNIAVHPAYRKIKIGELLFINILRIAVDLKVQTITLEVRESNQIAINLYSKYHFFPVSVRKKYYIDNGENAIIMKLSITNLNKFCDELTNNLNLIKEKFRCPIKIDDIHF